MKKFYAAAALILVVMGVLLVGSVWNDTATFDEVAHIPAGFANVALFDYRLNPEHPPLVKALAGLSAWIMARPVFPTNTAAWQEVINGQWAQGAAFLYDAGNDADALLFWARFPLILVTLLLGILIFWWTRRRFGASAALMALTLYAFSPTVLAHGRYVTTDVGAALAFFIGIGAFVAFLEAPSWRNALLTGVVFGIAQLCKFSLILLMPTYGIMLVAWVWAQPRLRVRERLQQGSRLLGKTLAIGVVGVLVIGMVYALFVWNYPQERQLRDAEETLKNNPLTSVVAFDLLLINHRLTRPLGQYLFGLLMATQRVGGGNTRYFLGEVSSRGSPIYFPLLYAVKESLAFHILTLLALIAALERWRRQKYAYISERMSLFVQMRRWAYREFSAFSLLAGIAVYALTSLTSPLNIGVRHILPILPLLYILVARSLARWVHEGNAVIADTWGAWFKNLYQRWVRVVPKYFLLIGLFAWLIISTAHIYPHFLSYYNALAGGPERGVWIATDSNYDWGQDLGRLRDYMTAHGIEKISLDYFGGGSPKYYLGNRVEPWWSSRGPAHGWFAISANARQGAWGRVGQGFSRAPEDSYLWLRPYEPMDTIGYSLLLYRLP